MTKVGGESTSTARAFSQCNILKDQMLQNAFENCTEQASDRFNFF